ncbi:hypothetical protein Tco_0455928 [Tanacetum coccineum]
MDKEIDLEKKIKELDNIVYKVGQSAQTVHILTKPHVFYDNAHKRALGYQNPFYLKKVLRIKSTLYDGSVISDKHVASLVFDDEETLILEEVSRSKMLAKQNDPISNEKKVNTTPINYAELNRLSEDFDKCFVPQQELSDEQSFRLQTSHPNTNQSASSTVKIEAPRKLPKIDLSKCYSQLEKHCISLELTMQLNQEIFQKESFTNNQNALEIPKYFENNDLKAQLQAKDTTIYKLKEHTKTMRENDKEEKVKQKIETINIELEHSVAKLLYENECLHKEIEHLKKIYKDQFDSIKKIRALSKEHDDSLIAQLNSKSMENTDLKRQIQDKVKCKSWFCWISFDYRVTVGFSSIAGGLDHVNPVIRLPLEHGISRVLGKDDHSNSMATTSIQYYFGKTDPESIALTASMRVLFFPFTNTIVFRILFNDSDDEDYTVIFDKNSFPYKVISTNDLKTDSENDNEKVNLPSLLSPEPTVSCFDDLDFFKDFENEFTAIVYNDAQTSKSDLLTESILSPQHIDEFDLNDKTSLSEYDEEEQNVLYFTNLFSFNIIHPDDLKSKKDNDDNEVDIIQSSGVEGYTEEIVHDFEQRLEMIFGRQVNRVHILDFGGLTPDMRQDLAERIRMVYTRDDGHEIMVSTMATRNAGRRIIATRGRGTSEQDGREGERFGDQAGNGRGSSRGNGANGGGGGVPDFPTITAQQLQNLLPTIIAQVGNHVNNQGNNRNQNDNVINDNNQGNVRTMNNGRGGCSYKEFMACSPKDYDWKGGAIIYTRWIEKMESVQDMSGRGENHKVKYTSGSFIASHTVYTDRFHELARLVPHLVTLENKRIERYIYVLAPQTCAMVAATEPTTIQSAIQKARMLTDEAIRNGALKKITEKRGNSGELSRDVIHQNLYIRNNKIYNMMENYQITLEDKGEGLFIRDVWRARGTGGATP